MAGTPQQRSKPPNRATSSQYSAAPTVGVARVAYEPLPGASVDSEARVLADVYSFVLERHGQKQMSAESPAGTNTAKAERRDKSDEVRPAKRGGGRRAEEG